MHRINPRVWLALAITLVIIPVSAVAIAAVADFTDTKPARMQAAAGHCNPAQALAVTHDASWPVLHRSLAPQQTSAWFFRSTGSGSRVFEVGEVRPNSRSFTIKGVSNAYFTHLCLSPDGVTWTKLAVQEGADVATLPVPNGSNPQVLVVGRNVTAHAAVQVPAIISCLACPALAAVCFAVWNIRRRHRAYTKPSRPSSDLQPV